MGNGAVVYGFRTSITDIGCLIERSRFDKMDNRLEVMEVKQNKMHEQLTELQLSQKLFELNTNKKLARLQDGLDTVEEILKMNELIPQ